jgi:rhamnosyltransferase
LRWGKKVVEAGYKLVYEPRSAVLRSHERGAAYDLRRYYVDQRLLLELFGLALVPNSVSLLLNVLRSSAYLYRWLRREEEAEGGALRFALLAVKLKHALYSRVGAYLGVKNGRLAETSAWISTKLEGFLSRGV